MNFRTASKDGEYVVPSLLLIGPRQIFTESCKMNNLKNEFLYEKFL